MICDCRCWARVLLQWWVDLVESSGVVGSTPSSLWFELVGCLQQSLLGSQNPWALHDGGNELLQGSGYKLSLNSRLQTEPQRGSLASRLSSVAGPGLESSSVMNLKVYPGFSVRLIDLSNFPDWRLVN